MDLRKLDALVAEHVLGIPPAKKYSTDIAAAWEVVEKMMPEAFILELVAGGMSWSCGFRIHGKINMETSGHAPLAICLAALKAKGVDVSEREQK